MKIINSLGMKLHPEASSLVVDGLSRLIELRHGKIDTDRYDYSKVVLRTLSTPVIIIDKYYGEFTMKLVDHWAGKLRSPSGFPQPNSLSRVGGCVEDFTKLEGFLRATSKVHGDLYTYTNYQGIDEKVTITCKAHGDFVMIARKHLWYEGGCHKCREEKRIKVKLYNEKWELWLQERKENSRKRKEDEKAVKAKNKAQKKVRDKLLFAFVPTNDWERRNHKTFSGNPTTLYYVKLTHPETNVVAWKLGITKYSTASRFSDEINKGYGIQLLHSLSYHDGWEAYHAEQYLLKKQGQHLVYNNHDNPYLPESGNTEVLNSNVFGEGIPHILFSNMYEERVKNVEPVREPVRDLEFLPK